MGNTINGRTHSFHADASAFGGHIEKPFEHIIAAQAPLTLSPDGGYNSLRVDMFRVEGLFSFKSAYTQVSGIVSKKRPGWTTLATSVIEGLNIAEVMTADRVVAQLITDHPAEAGRYAPMVNFVGTRFDNLRFGSCQVEVDLDLDLCKPEKTDSYGFPEVRTMDDPRFLGVLEQRGQYNSAVKGKSQIECSLVEKITLRGKFPGPQPQGNVLTIPGFGKITLAELIVDCNSYRLNMFRLELGCPTQGGLSGPNLSGNGTSAP
jgi:hypothetical protein